jgi:hypothetical protein
MNNPRAVSDPPHKDTAFAVVVGARGWQHRGWEGTYYPTDLPAQWRISYYANDFSGVMVPEREWRRISPEQLRRWRNDTPEGFGFFLETTDPGAHDAVQAAEALGDRLAGFVGVSGPAPTGSLAAVPLPKDPGAGARILLLTPGDLADRRLLGRRLTAIAQQAVPPRALIVSAAAGAAAIAELRLLAEVAGLA